MHNYQNKQKDRQIINARSLSLGLAYQEYRLADWHATLVSGINEIDYYVSDVIVIHSNNAIYASLIRRLSIFLNCFAHFDNNNCRTVMCWAFGIFKSNEEKKNLNWTISPIKIIEWQSSYTNRVADRSTALTLTKKIT